MKKSLLAVIFITTGLFGVERCFEKQLEEEVEDVEGLDSQCNYYCRQIICKTGPDRYEVVDKIKEKVLFSLEEHFTFKAGFKEYMILTQYTDNANGTDVLYHYLIDGKNKKKIMILREEKEDNSDYKFILGEIFLVQNNTKNNTTKILRIAQLLKNAEPIKNY